MLLSGDAFANLSVFLVSGPPNMVGFLLVLMLASSHIISLSLSNCFIIML